MDLRTLNHQPLADEEVFESDDEEDVPESAIDDEEEEEEEDGSEWEDSVDENDQHVFLRVDSKPNLVSRQSLLTQMIHETDRKTAFQQEALRSSPTLQRSRNMLRNRPSLGRSPEEEEAGLAMRGSKMPSPKPINMKASSTHPPALSPRSTRQNMLATELTESLRKHLLWERQQKSTTANAVLKRRHTAFDVTNLQEYPGAKGRRGAKDSSKNNSWNHFFDYGLGEYHQTGW